MPSAAGNQVSAAGNQPSAAGNQVSVRQLPGTSVLFVDLTRSSPTGQTRRMPNQRIISPFNLTTSADLRSRTGNNVLISNTSQIANQTLPGSIGIGGSVRMDPRIRPPTQDECLAQRMELWCDPQKPWDGTPGLSRWCLLNCRADNCDNQRCACACMDELLFKAKYEQLSLRAP
ncbi:uncharacterized protein LOC123542365 [Mercenaria mercenaria]|uniref:uncharacterized protein LOC123542365 n=1 Tax=Mercenaria mercenaria TaxID=6596 RepID=UPI00234E77A3|nr:uncharacterized protein LOC123542365 [Mercenaria mercenaria]